MQPDIKTRPRPRHRKAAVTASEIRRKGKQPPGTKDTIKLFQLAICMLIFIAVFIVKNFFPGGAEFIKSKVTGSIEQSIDYTEIFGTIGEAVKNGEVLETFKNIYGEIFETAGETAEERSADTDTDNISEAVTVPAASENEQPVIITPGEQTVMAPGRIDEEKEEIAAAANRLLLSHKTELTSRSGLDSVISNAVREFEKVQTTKQPETSNLPPVPDVVNMERVKIDIKSKAPLKGDISSPFGYRDHPVDGEYKFHYGIDIKGAHGDTITAFAAGTVYEVTQNNTYGKFFRIDHGNGITTMYAHCSKITVKKGQKVKLGEKIALVGQTGTATGPHLHFELRKDGKLVNPAYYADFS